MSSLTVRTKPITREKLAQFFPGNHELVRFLESIAQDVIINIPDAINPAIDVLDAAQQTGELANALAIAARGIAAQALMLALQSTEGPPPLPPPTPDAPDDLYAQVGALRERLAVVERAIANLKEGPTP